jgi:aspartyl-tRNA(Asn)/glutamyl-tRNA(Gln) amidotransferase subunit B
MNAPVDPKKLIKGGLHDWEVIVGMEIHAQVSSRAKLFSGASTEFGAEPNDHVSLVDAAMPGHAAGDQRRVRGAQAVRTGLGLKAKINLRSVFDRKNYFYPDLPQGYQISQYKDPIVGEGEVRSTWPTAPSITVGIERLHLEQDAGKSLHDQDPTRSFVDLNRSGVALMEIVSKPDLRSSEEAKAYVTKLRTILRYLGTCDGDMEKGSPPRRRERVGAPPRRAARHALRDQERQLDPLHRAGDRDRGAAPDRDPRGRRHDRPGDAAVRPYQGRDALDALEGGGARLPLLPRSGPAAARIRPGLRRRPRRGGCPNCRTPRRRGSSRRSASRPTMPACWSPSAPPPTSTRRWPRAGDGKAAANWVINELFGRLNKEGLSIEATPVSADQLGTIIDLIGEGVISGKIAKDLFEIVWTEGGDPRAARREPRHEAGHRHGRHRGGGRSRSSRPIPTRSRRPRRSRPCSAGSSVRP